MIPPYDRYLRLLGVDRAVSGLEGLRYLIGRQLARVPFENISKLLAYERAGGGSITAFEEYLDRIESLDLGGTCYTNNPFFAGLLRHAGYDAGLLGADMSEPDVHTTIRVRMDGAAYHVDVGFAAPFREPVRLDRLPVEVREGANRYVFEPVVGALLRVNQFRGDEYEMCYTAHEPPRSREFFDNVVMRSYSPQATFLQRLRISKVFEHRSVDLIDRTLVVHRGGASEVRQIGSLAEMKNVVAREFSMPRCPLEPALAVLERLTGKPFFPV